MTPAHTLDQLKQLRLDGMLAALGDQATSSAAAKLGFDARLSLLVQREIDDDFLGRVFSLFDIAVNLALVVGIAAVAFTCPESGVAPVAFVVIGVVIAGNALWYARYR